MIGIIYGALCCLAQTDMKRLIAFSSVAHMGFVMLGIATLTTLRPQRRRLRHGRPRPHHRHALLPRRLGEGALPHARDQAARRPAAAGAAHGLDPRLLRDGLARVCPASPGSGASSRRSSPSYQPAAGLSERAVPRRTWSSPRSAPCSPPATCSGCSSAPRSARRRRSSRTTHVHDVDVPEWIAWTPLLIAHRRARLLPQPHLPHDRRRGRAVTLRGARRLTRCTSCALASSSAFTTPTVDYHALAPEIVLTATIVVLLLVDLFLDERQKWAHVVDRRASACSPRSCPVLTLAVDGDRPVDVRRRATSSTTSRS